MKKTLTLLFCAIFALNAFGEVSPSYYDCVNNKSGKDLFDATQTAAKIGNPEMSYKGLWSAYEKTDLKPNGKIWDMYGDCDFTFSSDQCGIYSVECDCYNREHSIPKSWFGGAESKVGADIFHIVPTDGKVNGMRSNFAFGEVDDKNVEYTYAGAKLGASLAVTIENTIVGATTTQYPNTKVFEPIDEYKGDFARGYFGTMVRWANGDYQTFTSGDGAKMFSTGYTAAQNYGLTDYGVALLMKWHREDPVSQKEIDRNDGIQATQGNRNPFIDYPDLAEYIWGSKNGQMFRLSEHTLYGGAGEENTDPTIIVPTTSVDFGTCNLNATTTRTLKVSGKNLQGAISLALSGANASLFTLSSNTVSTSEAVSGKTITISYRPTAVANHTATLTLSTANADVVRVSLAGSAKIDFELLNTTNVTANSFTANWTNAGYSGYTVDVFTRESEEVTTEENVTFYEKNFLQNISDFEINNVSGYTPVWTYDSKYGAYGTAYAGKPKSNHAAESWLISPSIDLTKATQASLTINHVMRFGLIANLEMRISENNGASWSPLTFSSWKLSDAWTYYDQTVSLAAFVGKTIKVAFVYKSTNDAAGTWEIKTLTIAGKSNVVTTEAVEHRASGYPKAVGNVTSHTVTGLEPNTLYYYTVTPQGGTKSTEKTVTTSAGISTELDAAKIGYTYFVAADRLYLNNLQPAAEVCIFDLSGRIVAHRNACNTNETFALQRGAYLVRINESGNVSTIKVVR